MPFVLHISLLSCILTLMGQKFWSLCPMFGTYHFYLVHMGSKLKRKLSKCPMFGTYHSYFGAIGYYVLRYPSQCPMFCTYHFYNFCPAALRERHGRSALCSAHITSIGKPAGIRAAGGYVAVPYVRQISLLSICK